MDRIDHLSTRLAKLQRLDQSHVVFGASGHCYRTKPWSIEKVSRLETKLSHKLPKELSEWLVRVGGGPAPCYGLEPQPCHSSDRAPINETFGGDFQSLVDVKLSDVQSLLDRAWSKSPNEFGNRDIPPTITTVLDQGGPSLLNLGDAGCSYDFVMPLIGELRGKVFYRTDETIDENDVEHGSMLWPQGLCQASTHESFMDSTLRYKQEAGTMFGFLDWIDNWLEESIYLVENYAEYERQLDDWREENLGWRAKPKSRIHRFLDAIRLH